AGETFEALVKLKPTDATAHLNLGIVAFNKKKMDDAESHLRKAIELKSPGPSAHYYLGLTFIGSKRYPDAVTEFQAAISNGGENLASRISISAVFTWVTPKRDRKQSPSWKNIWRSILRPPTRNASRPPSRTCETSSKR